MSSVPRYRHQVLADLAHLVIDPLVRDCIAVATPKPAEAGDETEALSPAAIAIWASVSQEVELRIKEQIKAGAFPIRLRADDWKSGDRVWLLDIIAPSRKLATDVLQNFNRIAGVDAINIHPMVSQLVDKYVLGALTTNVSLRDATEKADSGD